MAKYLVTRTENTITKRLVEAADESEARWVNDDLERISQTQETTTVTPYTSLVPATQAPAEPTA